ncbi:MAG: hypothetical protein CMM97_05105 [Rickettsiales bacterium]|nr:hypothetical protein [Rickettsiales bacterium]
MILKAIIGLVIFILLIYVLKAFARANPKKILKFLKIIGIILLTILVFYLAGTGKFLAALGGITGIISLLVKWGILWKQLNALFNFKKSSEHGKEKLAEMSRREALEVLGLQESCSKDDVRFAHKKLIKGIHPDQGGSDWLAAKINHAKDILLGK